MKKIIDKDDVKKISNALLKKKSKIKAYCEIMRILEDTNGEAALDPKIQGRYKWFYAMVHLPKNFDDNYYFNFLKDNYHNKSITFDKIIKSISTMSGRNEASFSSKLLATINPDRAVWDSKVRKVLGIPDVKSVGEAIKEYKNLENIIKNKYLPLVDEYRKIVDEVFGNENWYKKYKITDMKIIDLVLWSL